jgi:adenylate cyclase
MSEKLDYTSLAQRFSARFPLISYLGIQINFWVVANILLGIIMHLQAMSISQKFNLPAFSRLGPIFLIAVIVGILCGISLGLTDYYLDKNFFKKQPLGKVILFKTAVSLMVLIFLIGLIRLFLSDFIISPQSYRTNFTLSNRSWKYLFYILGIYYFFMILVINFINQVNKRYGPGILVPLLLGKYRNPREEERIFLFMA